MDLDAQKQRKRRQIAANGACHLRAFEEQGLGHPVHHRESNSSLDQLYRARINSLALSEPLGDDEFLALFNSSPRMDRVGIDLRVGP